MTFDKMVHKSDSYMLSKEEYNRLSEMLGTLRSEIAALNWKMVNDKPFRQTFPTKRQFEAWKDRALQRRDQLAAEYNAAADIMAAAERAAKAIGKIRRARIDGVGITAILVRAKETIERLNDQAGDQWSEEDRMICWQLKSIVSQDSPLLNLVSREKAAVEHAELQRQHANDIAVERAASQQAVGVLKAQIRDIQEQRGRAAAILERLYSERYQEVDTFRTARGITHRVHLTAEDCASIEQAIRG